MTGTTTIGELITRYDIRLQPFGDEDRMQVWKYDDANAARTELLPRKAEIIAELRRRERDAEKARVRRLAREHPADLPDLKPGDIVVWFDEQAPWARGIQRADAIIDGAAFGYHDGLIAVLSETDDGLANDLGVDPWLLDFTLYDAKGTGLDRDDYERVFDRVLSQWTSAHPDRRVSRVGAHRIYWRIGHDEAIALAGDVRDALEARVRENREAEIEARRRVIDKWNRQVDRPETEADVRRLEKRYNDVMNEGGSGYVPEWISHEGAERAAAWLREHGVEIEVEEPASTYVVDRSTGTMIDGPLTLPMPSPAEQGASASPAEPDAPVVG